MVRRRVPAVIGIVATASVAIGYALEWVRQRGDCDMGDATPNTLPLSVLLILIGGVVLGLVGTCLTLLNSMKRHHVLLRDLVLPVAAMIGGASIFLFAGSGPGGWFQYCGT